MQTTLRKRANSFVAILATAALFSGCAVLRPERELPPGAQPPPRAVVEPGDYSVEPGHGTELVAELRAAAAPEVPETTAGSAIGPDERKLVGKSFVRIGSGSYPSNDDAAHAWALRIGQRVGADKILIYAPSTDAKDNAEAPFVAVFYVRYKLPFGAQFRSLSEAQMKALGVDGGVQIGEVVGGTPAAEANLRSGDFVLKFNGAPVHNRAAFQDLLRANMGKRVTLSVSRDGAQFDRLVRLGVLATESHKVEK
jgi:membrane-associated protease RseP (regulator of RpoE activity)